MINWDVMLDEELWINIAIIAGITIASYLILQTVLRIITNRLRKLAKGSRSGFVGIAAEMLSRTSHLLLIARCRLVGPLSDALQT